MSFLSPQHTMASFMIVSVSDFISKSTSLSTFITNGCCRSDPTLTESFCDEV